MADEFFLTVERAKRKLKAKKLRAFIRRVSEADVDRAIDRMIDEALANPDGPLHNRRSAAAGNPLSKPNDYPPVISPRLAGLGLAALSGAIVGVILGWWLC